MPVKAWLTLQTPSSGISCLHDARVPSMERYVMEGCSGLRHTWVQALVVWPCGHFLTILCLSSSTVKGSLRFTLLGCCDIRVR